MKDNIDVDTRFSELLHAIDQFYNLPDKDDISRTVAIAKQLLFSSPNSPRVEDLQKAIGYLKGLDFANNTYCEEAKNRLIKLIV